MTRTLITAALLTLMATTTRADETPDLMAAAADRDTSQVRILLTAGADIDASDAAGNTALMVAAARGYADIAAILVDAGADVNAAGYIGNTALIYAAGSGSVAIGRMLIDAGADPRVANDYGNDARGLAAGYGHHDLAAAIDAAPAPAAAPVALAF